jgi:hypothetical protein
MKFGYFDESIHDRAGFILSAFVFSAIDLTPLVYSALVAAGLRPGVDEYKSGTYVGTSLQLQRLREHIRLEVQSEIRVGLLVAPLEERPVLGSLALAALAKLERENAALSVEPHTVYFDSGIFTTSSDIERIARAAGIAERVTLAIEQDSRIVGGIQVADLIAHTLSTRLLARMGHVRKTIVENDYVPSGSAIPLHFALFREVRHQLFHRNLPREIDGVSTPHAVVDTSCAVYISPNCSPTLAEAVHREFDRTYVGCTR